MIQATPLTSPFPVEAFLRPSASEHGAIAQGDSTGKVLATTAKDESTSCKIPVRVGLFFDGTNNNLYRDRFGLRVPVPDPDTKNKKEADKKGTSEGKTIRSKAPSPEEASHSNIARLYSAYPQDKQPSGYFPYYMQGVGTPFDEIGEPTESTEGKAFGQGGDTRITWALLQVLNSVFTTRTGLARVLYTPARIGELAQEYNRKVGSSVDQEHGPAKTITHLDWFKTHLARVRAELENTPKPAIPSLTLDVFGFSRGAAEAVAFCHLFNELLEDGKLVGIPATINFLGVFDVVASVSISASVAQTLPVPDFIANGHRGWAKSLLRPLPSCVLKGLHCVAAHEQRMNFPVTVLEGSANVKQFYFPGVHSDVGGGYGPGESGKCRGGQSSMLSQIPLAYMFKEARLASVPFRPFSELEETLKADFQVAKDLASAWEAYTNALGSEGSLLMKHMQLYYRWRAARLKTLESTATYIASSPQSQQDYRESNQMLEGDVLALKIRRNPELRPPIDDTGARLSRAESSGMSQWQRIRTDKNTPDQLNDWEKWALEIFERPEPLPADVMRFFDDYVHDSLAGFYMAGEVTEYDKREKTESVLRKFRKKGLGALNRFEKRVYEVAKKTEAANAKKAAGEPLSPEEERLAYESEGGTPYPVMTDEDAPEMRSALILTQTSTRREGGGYFLRRGYFPHSGFIFFRKSKYEEQLERRPSAQAQVPINTKDEVVYEAVWFDDGAMNFRKPNMLPDDTQMKRIRAIA